MIVNVCTVNVTYQKWIYALHTSLTLLQGAFARRRRRLQAPVSQAPSRAKRA
jgi:hypothetical protein